MEPNYDVTMTFHIPPEIASKKYPNAQHHYSVWDAVFKIDPNVTVQIWEGILEDNK